MKSRYILSLLIVLANTIMIFSNNEPPPPAGPPPGFPMPYIWVMLVSAIGYGVWKRLNSEK